jgi:cytochrome o ubiquinol oxidase subunit 2
MNRNYIAIAFLGITVLFAVLVTTLRSYSFGVLNPQGLIAQEEQGLILHAILLMLIVVIPVFILAFTIAWRYRAGNTKATYTPEWEKLADGRAHLVGSAA